MDFWEGLTKIDNDKINISLIIFLTILCPGILIIFFFKPELYLTLSMPKLIFLAISFIGPIYLINQGVCSHAAVVSKAYSAVPVDKVVDEYFYKSVIELSCSMTLTAIIIPLLNSCIFHLNVRYFLYNVIGLEAGLIFIIYFITFKYAKHKK